MPRSSESIAALGCALAKAQAELINPEKSLTATIRTGRAGEGAEQTFRYAPLSTGLDIVRKTLGQHEIATVQTTAVEQTGGLINLTTMLVHASGEWIASDWPVCPIADLASPRRMGAALTYARRYALFTLVGIAGEDDLDAPDLHDQAAPESPSLGNRAGNGVAAPNGSGAALAAKSHPSAPGPDSRGRRRPGSRPTAPVILAPDQSAELRDRLLAELVAITSADEATAWARTALPAKNTLTLVDAGIVEEAFERLIGASDVGANEERDAPSAPTAGCGDDESKGQGARAVAAERAKPEAIAAAATATLAEFTSIEPGVKSVHEPLPARIDKSALALPEPKRHRNKEHLRFVAQQPCLICARTPSDPHHLRFAQPRALGRKVSDEFVVPLCRTHHRSLHRVGNEPGWWKATGIDPLDVARKLWGQTRLIEQPEPVTVSAAPEPLRVAADPRPGSAPPPQTPRRGGRRINHTSARANGRMPR